MANLVFALQFVASVTAAVLLLIGISAATKKPNIVSTQGDSRDADSHIKANPSMTHLKRSPVMANGRVAEPRRGLTLGAGQ